MKEPFDSILSNKSKKLKKEADKKMYFDNTHDPMGLYKNPKLPKENEDSDGEEKEKSQPKGKALLKKVYGGACWKDYEQFGMKEKSGKKVPNCIPKKMKGGITPSNVEPVPNNAIPSLPRLVNDWRFLSRMRGEYNDYLEPGEWNDFDTILNSMRSIFGTGQDDSATRLVLFEMLQELSEFMQDIIQQTGSGRKSASHKKMKGGKMEVPNEEKVETENEVTDERPEAEDTALIDIVENTGIENDLNEVREWYSAFFPEAVEQGIVTENERQEIIDTSDILNIFVIRRNLTPQEYTEFNRHYKRLVKLYKRIDRKLDRNIFGMVARRMYVPDRTWGEFLTEARGFLGFGREGGCSVSNNSKKENCGCSKSLNPKRVTKNYNKIISHLEEHLAEKAGDPKDASQSKMLKKEVQKIKAEGSTPVSKLTKKDNLYKVSNPREVQKKAFEIYGKDAIIYKSDKPNKKYKIFDKISGKFVHFGDPKMEDFNKHKDPERRQRYLKRALNIKGKWRDNPYSPNMLATVLLWDAE